MPHSRPSALIVTRNLPPLVGGMERLIWHIVNALKDDYRTTVVGPRGSTPHLPPSVDAQEVPLRPLYRFLLGSALTAVFAAIRQRPSVILAGSGLTAPIVWLAARLSGARSVVYLHGLDVEAQHPIYRLIWRPVFKNFDLVIVNSKFTRDLALETGVSASRIHIIPPGVDLPDLSLKTKARAAFRQRLDLGDVPVMLYVGRITPRKGLTSFVEKNLPHVVASAPTARVVVIGDEPHGALLNAARGERARAEHALREADLNHAVLFLGECSQDDPVLSEAYFGSDVMIFPVQDRPGDNEGFGMVAVEAAAHELPTVAFGVGGVTDAVCDGVSGKLIRAGDSSAFTDALIERIKTPASCNSRKFAETFAWTEFDKKIRGLIDTVIKSEKAAQR